MSCRAVAKESSNPCCGFLFVYLPLNHIGHSLGPVALYAGLTISVARTG